MRRVNDRSSTRRRDRGTSVAVTMVLLALLALLPVPITASAGMLAGPDVPAPSGAVLATGAGTAAVVPQVAAGGAHTCALSTDGTVRCWGDNRFGQLGDGTATSRPNPAQVLAAGSLPGVDVLSGVREISAGIDHTCALLADGTVRCWGANWDGALGDGTRTPRLKPVQVLASGSVQGEDVLAGVTQIASGGYHTCALLLDGTLRCWGANWAPGQLGDGTDADERVNPVQVLASGAAQGVDVLSGVVQVSAGEEHTCALLADGTVRCWGANLYGGLGDGTGTDRLNPVEVYTSGQRNSEPPPVVLAGVTQVLAGAGYTCALLSDATLRCWGQNASGQLGDGTTTSRMTPVEVLVGVTQVSTSPQVSTGEDSTCATLADGTLRCWGSNAWGQLGDGTTTGRPDPAPVLADGTPDDDPVVLTGAIQVASGARHACAVLADTTVRCWGSNGWGQLGDGTNATSLAPVAVLVSGTASADPVALDRVTQISSGFGHTCALREDRTVHCWGLNFGPGQLGDGTNEIRRTPGAVLASGKPDADPVPLTGVLQVSSGPFHTCAVIEDRTARCWGADGPPAEGLLGDGSATFRLNPVTVLASGTSQVDPVALTGVAAVSSGGTHTCATLLDGTARCWGSNRWGQVGDGTTTSRSNPVPVLLIGAVGISAGLDHTCAVLVDATARCWGSNGSGRLGDASSIGVRLTPVAVLASGFGTGVPPVLLDLGRAVSVDRALEGAAVEGSLALACGPLPQVGRRVTCTVTGGTPGVEIEWRAAFNPVFAGAGVTLDADGVGTFDFMIPPGALGRVLTVELVDWLAPSPFGAVAGPVPTSIPSGQGPGPNRPLGLLGLLVLLAGIVPIVLLPSRDLRPAAPGLRSPSRPRR